MPGRSHFNLFNKDTRDLFMLFIVFMCQLNHVLFTVIVRYFVHCSTFPFILCSTFVSFDSFAFYCSLFNRKKFNSDPGLYSRYFDPVQPVVREVLYKNAIYHLCKSINIIQQTAPTLS
jgi:hypothetical protein